LRSRQRDLLGVDAVVKETAARFNKPTSKDDLLKMVRGINARLVLHETDADTLRSNYLRRPAGEILKSGKIMTEVSGAGGMLIGGCMDQTLVIMAVLRAKGFVSGKNLFFIRVKSNKGPAHSLAEVELDGVRYFVDPRNERVYGSLDKFVKIWLRAIRTHSGGVVMRGATPYAAGVRKLSDAFHPNAFIP